ncbi:Fe-S protein assembly co-chaperone HscB [Chitinophaga japonensis]|uniref:Molecular chaperone HscB n=1 Tax=Chitinophaga japonensis TaxID=104662 RepID=A0A562SMX6_CHIJA|nr:Fe-S protein assembly co-chaperone HscB [Chitinophaga japonensis]TWI82639.1 molecular chaperone HscB [Chitinophaga japonensis]
MNYFELLGMPVSLQVDTELLRRRYYALSRQYHPDMHTQAGAAVQAEMLEKSALLNRAFQVLGDGQQLLAYVLELNGLPEDTAPYQLPELFLMEMMDIHEKLLELEYDPEEEAIAALQQQVKEMEQEVCGEVAEMHREYDVTVLPALALYRLKECYYKRKYLLGILDKLATFASRI